LEIEPAGECVRGAAERGVFGCVVESFASNPHLTPIILQSRQKLLTRSCPAGLISVGALILTDVGVSTLCWRYWHSLS
jgi:hypothetical protein